MCAITAPVYVVSKIDCRSGCKCSMQAPSQNLSSISFCLSMLHYYNSSLRSSPQTTTTLSMLPKPAVFLYFLCPTLSINLFILTAVSTCHKVQTQNLFYIPFFSSFMHKLHSPFFSQTSLVCGL